MYLLSCDAGRGTVGTLSGIESEVAMPLSTYAVHESLFTLDPCLTYLKTPLIPTVEKLRNPNVSRTTNPCHAHAPSACLKYATR
jgi:hypothetical protein